MKEKSKGKTIEEQIESLEFWKAQYQNKAANVWIGKQSDIAIYNKKRFPRSYFRSQLFADFTVPLVIPAFLIYSPIRTIYFAICYFITSIKLNRTIYKKIKQDRDIKLLESNIETYKEKSLNVFKNGHSIYYLFAKWISEHWSRIIVFLILSIYTVMIFVLLFIWSPIRKLLFIKRIRKLERLGRTISI